MPASMMHATAPPTAAHEHKLKVALTGGVASGKTTVSNLFAALGVPIIDSDLIAREVVAPGTALLTQIFERFGPGLQQADGGLDRTALRARVFANEDERKQLEALMHPAIRARSDELAARAVGPYLMFVIPLLVETHGSSHFGRVLVVDCPEALQLQRLQERDRCDLRQAQAILATQASRQDRLAVADDIILNDCTAASLEQQVRSLHERYLKLAHKDVYAQ
jgi:dephospho-CoA kinase